MSIPKTLSLTPLENASFKLVVSLMETELNKVFLILRNVDPKNTNPEHGVKLSINMVKELKEFLQEMEEDMIKQELKTILIRE